MSESHIAQNIIVKVFKSHNLKQPIITLNKKLLK